MNEKVVEQLKRSIRGIPDFPKKGILFRDVSTLLKDGQRFKQSIELIAEKYQNKKVTKIVAVEARGFIFGAALAYKFGLGFIPVRKKGKLPADVDEVTYQLEYGTDTLQIHCDALNREDKVVLVDDLLATGGTTQATCKLIEKSGAEIVGIEFLIELVELKGREKLKSYPVDSIVKF